MLVVISNREFSKDIFDPEGWDFKNTIIVRLQGVSITLYVPAILDSISMRTF